MGQPNNVDPIYARLRVAEADAQIKAHREDIKRLQDRRKKFEPFLPKKDAKASEPSGDDS